MFWAVPSLCGLLLARALPCAVARTHALQQMPPPKRSCVRRRPATCRIPQEHEIRWYDRARPIDAEDRDFDLVTGLDGIGDDDPVWDVEALDRGRAGDADAARDLPVDPHFLT